MDIFAGRSVFLVHTPALIGRLGVRSIADQLQRANCAALLIRIGRGQHAEPGLTRQMAKDLAGALAERTVALIGWHVPFCEDDAATAAEIELVDAWAEEFSIAGFIADAERTPPPDTPRFQGTAVQARHYTSEVARRLADRQVPIAFSSHDQPNLHRDLPFSEFLSQGQPAMPQVYNNNDDPQPRLRLAEAAYQPLLGADFGTRFRPTANVSMVGDGGFKDQATCLRSLKRFLDRVGTRRYRGHSLWCWNEMPRAAWEYLTARPV